MIRPLDAYQPGNLFIDFEFSGLKPTVLGLSQKGIAHSEYWSDYCAYTLGRLNTPETTWIGHNMLSADKPILERIVGNEIPLARIHDTILVHYLANSDLCKQASKEETDKERGQGYMDLWSMCSLYGDVNQWKFCRGSKCSGPCPVHDFLGYNRMDCLAIDLIWPALYYDCFGKKKIPHTLYEKLKELVIVCSKMEAQGVKIDTAYISKFAAAIAGKKEALFPSREEYPIGKKGQPLKNPVTVWDAPFNPQSPKDILRYFAEYNVNLDGTDLANLEYALEHSRKMPEEARGWLEKLTYYKAAGKGVKSWFDETYIDRNDFAHPRFIPYSTSMGRLSSANPNFQNLPRIGWGRGIRAGIIPRDSSLQLIKADYSQIELRAMLWYAGVVPQFADAFTWLTNEVGRPFEIAAENQYCIHDKPRDIAKSVGHAGNYGEGLTLLGAKEMDSSRTRKLIDNGALLVYKDWEYCGKYVGFTGVNLAKRLFGAASYENRKMALEIQAAYLTKFSVIRELQKKISLQAEKDYIRSASGRYLKLSGTDEDKFKQALAMHGQGLGADLIEEKMVKYHHEGKVPLLSVHDELVLEAPVSLSNGEIKEVFSIMQEESGEFPGFSCPIKIGKGPNWLDMEEVK